MTVINILHYMVVMVQGIKKLVDRFKKTTLGFALTRFSENQSAVDSAGLTFYAVFSLFPLLLVIISVGSFILERFMSHEEIFDLVFNAVPMYQDVIRENITSVLEKRGAIGIIGLLSLLWSASGYFNTLVGAMNEAWPGIKPRGFFRKRLIAIGMILLLIVLLIVSILSTSIIDILSRMQIPLGGSVKLYDTDLWKFINNYLPYIMTFVIFYLLYFYTPNVKVKKRAALMGALFAALIWNVVNMGFTWYVSSRYFQYDIIYGSLSTIVSLLFWIYLTNMVLLFGAYLTASVQYKYFPESVIKSKEGSLPKPDV